MDEDADLQLPELEVSLLKNSLFLILMQRPAIKIKIEPADEMDVEDVTEAVIRKERDQANATLRATQAAHMDQVVSLELKLTSTQGSLASLQTAHSHTVAELEQKLTLTQISMTSLQSATETLEKKQQRDREELKDLQRRATSDLRWKLQATLESQAYLNLAGREKHVALLLCITGEGEDSRPGIALDGGLAQLFWRTKAPVANVSLFVAPTMEQKTVQQRISAALASDADFIDIFISAHGERGDGDVFLRDDEKGEHEWLSSLWVLQQHGLEQAKRKQTAKPLSTLRFVVDACFSTKAFSDAEDLKPPVPNVIFQASSPAKETIKDGHFFTAFVSANCDSTPNFEGDHKGLKGCRLHITDENGKVKRLPRGTHSHASGPPLFQVKCFDLTHYRPTRSVF